MPVGFDHLLERADRLLAADEERHDHMWEYDDVAQRQNRIGPSRARHDGLAWLRLCHEMTSFRQRPPSPLDELERRTEDRNAQAFVIRCVPVRGAVPSENERTPSRDRI